MPARSQPSKRGSSPAILEMSMPAKSITPRRSSRSIVLSSIPIWSSGVMSALIAPLEALGSVSRQNGTSSTIEATVGLLRPITLNWVLGRSCAETLNATSEPATIPKNVRVSIGPPPCENIVHDRRPVPGPHAGFGGALCAGLPGPSGGTDARLARRCPVSDLRRARRRSAQVGRRRQRVRRLLRRSRRAALRPFASANRRGGAAPGGARHALGRLARARSAMGRARAAARAFGRARALYRLRHRGDAARIAPCACLHRQSEDRALRRPFSRLARCRRAGWDVALRRLGARRHPGVARRRNDSAWRGRARSRSGYLGKP